MRSTTVFAVGVSLVAAASYVNNHSRAAELSHPPRGRFIEVDGVQLHYVDVGEGPPLVLLHGLGSCVEDFATSGLIAEASKRYRVLAFDRPGYGFSDRPRGRIWHPIAQARLLRSALQKLDVQRPIVAAHSWGTLVALAFALEFPGASRSLALASGLYFPSVRLDAPLLVPPAIPLVGALLRHTVSPLIGRLLWPTWLKTLFSPAPVPEHFKNGYPAWMALRPSQLKAVGEEAAMTLPATVALLRRYRDLTLPVVLVAGEADKYVRAKHSRRLHGMLPNSRLIMSPEAGHMIHHTDLGRVMTAIDAAAMGVAGGLLASPDARPQ
jgi:pimeloyl-ACP methyl ester carboxylesterase